MDSCAHRERLGHDLGSDLELFFTQDSKCLQESKGSHRTSCRDSLVGPGVAEPRVLSEPAVGTLWWTLVWLDPKHTEGMSCAFPEVGVLSFN